MNSNREDCRARLERKLLAIGGSKVTSEGLAADLYDLDELGKEYTLLPVRRTRRGKDVNTVTAKLWMEDVNRYRIAVGFALNADTWIPLSWIVSGSLFIDETSTRFGAYFGYELEPEAALEFWFRHYLSVQFRGLASLILEFGRKQDPKELTETMKTLNNLLASSSS